MTIRRRDGSTLLLALWALVLLSSVVFAWAKWMGAAMDNANEANRGLEARALAHSGMVVAMHPGVAAGSPLLKAEPEPGKVYRIAMESEGARINLNYLLAGEDPQKIAFLKQVLAARGLALPERETLMDNLLDWVGPAKGVRRPNSRQEGPDYRLPHRPLQSLDELRQVEGCGPLVAQPGWRDIFTLESTGPLDLEAVSGEWLALVPGVGEQRARRFEKLRAVRLRRTGDRDGHPYRTLDEALGDLGLSQAQYMEVSGLLGFRDPVCRITSVGISGTVGRKVTAIVRKDPGTGSQLLLWIENEQNNPPSS